MIAVFVPYFVARGVIADLLRGRNPRRRYDKYKGYSRGMSMIHDWIDWLGGYPFEVAKPDDIASFLSRRGFRLRKWKTWGRKLGCNEFVFERQAAIREGSGRREEALEGEERSF